MERGKWHALVQQLKLDPLAFSWLHLWWTGLESLKLIFFFFKLVLLNLTRPPKIWGWCKVSFLASTRAQSPALPCRLTHVEARKVAQIKADFNCDL